MFAVRVLAVLLRKVGHSVCNKFAILG
jgi:hypothetical protein